MYFAFTFKSRVMNHGPHPRRWVVPLLYLSSVGHLAEIVTLGTGTYFLTTAYLNPGKIKVRRSYDKFAKYISIRSAQRSHGIRFEIFYSFIIFIFADCIVSYNYPMILLTVAISMEYLGLAIILSIVWILTKDKCCPFIWGRKNRKDGSGGIFYTFLSYVCFGKSKVFMQVKTNDLC